MATEQFANNASSTLNGSITNVATSLVVTSATPFPTDPQFRLLIESELVLVTGVAGATFTVVRGIEGTTAVPHANSTPVTHIVTAGALAQRLSDTLPLETIGHRLTLTSAVPVTTSDVIGASTLYLTPYKSNRIAIYDTTNTRWSMFYVPEISIALAGLTTPLPYDVFAYNSTGTTVALELTAWTSDTARATSLVQQDGVWVSSADATRRYIGTIYTTGATTTEDSAANRLVWNYYNRVKRSMFVQITSGSYVYSSATYQAANGATSSSFEMVRGFDEDSMLVKVSAQAHHNAGTAIVSVGVGLDSQTVNSAIAYGNTITTTPTSLTAEWAGSPGVGYHQIFWLEQGDGTGTTTWDNSATSPNAMVGEVFA